MGFSSSVEAFLHEDAGYGDDRRYYGDPAGRGCGRGISPGCNEFDACVFDANCHHNFGKGVKPGQGHGNSTYHGIKSFNGEPVFYYNLHHYIFRTLKEDEAEGFELTSGLQLVPCYFCKENGKLGFASYVDGRRDYAVNAAHDIAMSRFAGGFSEEERIQMFVGHFADPFRICTTKELFLWTRILTLCPFITCRRLGEQMGLDLENDHLSAAEFLRRANLRIPLTCKSWCDFMKKCGR